MFKYDRTPHIEGSRLQKGDDPNIISFNQIKGRELVVEEKVDGANTGISFEDGKLMLQSRGHYLRGGPREEQFALFKQWANTHVDSFKRALGERYVMYGEWLYARHTMFYDALPHYFMEFDVLDKETGEYFSTARRRAFYMQHGLSKIIISVRVIGSGDFRNLDELRALMGRSAFITPHRHVSLQNAARLAGEDPDQIIQTSDQSAIMEGLYIKLEDRGRVLDRYKYVRNTFTQAILEQGEHWSKRQIIANTLAPGAFERMWQQ